MSLVQLAISGYKTVLEGKLYSQTALINLYKA